jgi:hypothetical protein
MHAKDVGCGQRTHDSEEPIMQTMTAIGLHIAKAVFQAHGIDAEGKVLMSRQLKHRYVLAFFQKLLPCLVGIERNVASLVAVSSRRLAIPCA